jgi:hypothetical protein
MAIDAGNFGRATRLLSAAQAARRRLNEPSTNPQEIADYDNAMEQLGETMGTAELDRITAEGRRLSLDEAVVLVLDRGDPYS